MKKQEKAIRHAPEYRRADTRRMAGRELNARRAEHTKTYELGRNMFQTVIFPEPVHYRNAGSGAWEEIDNRLSRKRRGAGAVWENATGPLRAALGDRANAEPLLRLDDGAGHALAWTLQGASDAPGRAEEAPRRGEGMDENQRRRRMNKLGGTLRYPNALPETDLLCHVRGACFKDELVLRGPGAPGSFTFVLRAEGAALATDADGTVYARAQGAEEPVFTVPPAIAYDANGEYGAIETRAEATSGGVRLTLIPDAAFLAGAAYPVVIDPVVRTPIYGNAPADGYVSVSNPGTISDRNTAAHTLRVGRYASQDHMACVRFGALPQMGPSYVVTRASLQMMVSGVAGVQVGKPVTVHAHAAYKNWLTEATLEPLEDRDPRSLDYAVIEKDVNTTFTQMISLDISGEVRKWYRDAAENFGIVLDMPYQQAYGAQQPGISLVSANFGDPLSAGYYNRPTLAIDFVHNVGLQGYWPFESHGLGRAGAAHVALHTGNLVVTRGLTAMSGERMPISLGLVYNACEQYAARQDATLSRNPFGVGDGWRLNWNQQLRWEKAREETSSVQGEEIKRTLSEAHYVLTDEDGTEHEFYLHVKSAEEKKDSDFVNYYEDRSGLSLKLYEKSDAGVNIAEIRGKEDTRLVFPRPAKTYTAGQAPRRMIRDVADAHGNTATFTYAGEDTKLTRVTDGVGRETMLTYTDGEVSIAWPGHEEPVRILLDAAQRMVGIIDVDGVASEYGYDGDRECGQCGGDEECGECYRGTGLLNKLIAPDGRNLAITYGDDQYRVSEVFEYAGAGDVTTPGNHRQYQYGGCVTQITDRTVADGKTLTYHLNDYGNLIAVHDELGYAAFAKYT